MTDSTQQRKPLHLTIITRDLANPDENVLRRIINQYSAADRKWLATHCWWAAHNNRSVTTAPCTLQEAVRNDY